MSRAKLIEMARHNMAHAKEGGGQRFHAFVDRLLETDDADLPGLF
ncbi:MAG: hypothetical protein O7G86_15695 [Gammaproteobacteria bacterium]|nr:hypothetical protein [Gammaproteobacteria bacterium]